MLLDIGGDRGALILHAPPSMEHVEIEVSPVGRDTDRTHVAVLARPVGATRMHAAVYPSLPAGAWRIWAPDGTGPVLVAEVPRGAVAEVRWPDRGAVEPMA